MHNDDFSCSTSSLLIVFPIQLFKSSCISVFQMWGSCGYSLAIFQFPTILYLFIFPASFSSALVSSSGCFVELFRRCNNLKKVFLTANRYAFNWHCWKPETFIKFSVLLLQFIYTCHWFYFEGSCWFYSLWILNDPFPSVICACRLLDLVLQWHASLLSPRDRTVCDRDLEALATFCPHMEQLDVLGTREVSEHVAQMSVTFSPSG